MAIYAQTVKMNGLFVLYETLPFGFLLYIIEATQRHYHIHGVLLLYLLPATVPGTLELHTQSNGA